jgi:hypothetical protein
MFEFAVVPDEDDAVVGVGETAGGEIRAVAGPDGRVRELRISPALLRHSRQGRTVLDAATLAAEITAAVNTALDDLARRAAAGALGDLDAGLTEVNETFDRAINAVTAELERAERLLEGR